MAESDLDLRCPLCNVRFDDIRVLEEHAATCMGVLYSGEAVADDELERDVHEPADSGRGLYASDSEDNSYVDGEEEPYGDRVESVYDAADPEDLEPSRSEGREYSVHGVTASLLNGSKKFQDVDDEVVSVALDICPDSISLAFSLIFNCVTCMAYR